MIILFFYLSPFYISFSLSFIYSSFSQRGKKPSFPLDFKASQLNLNGWSSEYRRLWYGKKRDRAPIRTNRMTKGSKGLNEKKIWCRRSPPRQTGSHTHFTRIYVYSWTFTWLSSVLFNNNEQYEFYYTIHTLKCNNHHVCLYCPPSSGNIEQFILTSNFKKFER